MASLLSMTGFGRGNAEADGLAATCDLRSVNHRFLDVKVRLPRDLLALEQRLVARIRETVRRGKLDVSVRVDVVGRSAYALRVDAELASAYRDAVDQVAAATGQPAGSLSVADLAGMEGVLTLRPVEVGDVAGVAVSEALEAALAEHEAMRRAEGAALAADLEARCQAIEAAVSAVDARVADQLPRLRAKMEERLQRLLGEVPVDPERVLAEAALLADRADVTEEIVRMRQHIAAFREALSATGSVGRKMDFLAQEMLREANTIGSKAWEAPVSLRVIDIKSEVERIREQVQNIE